MGGVNACEQDLHSQNPGGPPQSFTEEQGLPDGREIYCEAMKEYAKKERNLMTEQEGEAVLDYLTVFQNPLDEN